MMDDYVHPFPFESTPVDPRTEKWNRRYLKMAELVSSWSKDPSSKIGAVAIGDHGQVLSTGYNGFPRGIQDEASRLEDRETKLKYVVHAEMNAIFNASLTGVSLNGSTMYVHGLPVCSDCAKGLIQAGVSRVVIPADVLKKSQRWSDSWILSHSMLTEAGIKVEIMENEDG